MVDDKVVGIQLNLGAVAMLKVTQFNRSSDFQHFKANFIEVSISLNYSYHWLCVVIIAGNKARICGDELEKVRHAHAAAGLHLSLFHICNIYVCKSLMRQLPDDVIFAP